MEHHGGEWSYDQRHHQKWGCLLDMHQGACEVSTAWCLLRNFDDFQIFTFFFENMEDRMHSCSLKFVFESSILSNVCVSGGATPLQGMR